MSRISPTLEGFRATWRLPSLTFAEISWRWVVGATAWALLAFSFIEYLRTLPVSNSELLLLRTRHPALVANALAHIMRGSFNRAVMSILLGGLMLALLWIVAASIGRAATLRNLLGYFADRKAAALVATNSSIATASDKDFAVESPKQTARPVFGSLFGLNFLRVAVTLAAVLGFIGAKILAGFVSTDINPRPGLAFLLFLPMAAFICFAWWQLNWFLSLAALFAVRNSENALSALLAAVAFCRERVGAVFAVSTWFELAHLVLFVGASTVIAIPLGFVPLVPARLALAVMCVLSLFYFAIADWLYMGRLAGYVCIAEMPEALLAPPSLPALPYVPPPTPSSRDEFPASAPSQTAVDRDETILSDLANPAVSSEVNDAEEISALVARELQRITDVRLAGKIRGLLVTPYPVERAWDYGAPDERFTCWTVLEHRASNTGIAFCAGGFGPSYPWGLVFLSGPHMSIGMDSGWFVSLEEAMRDSMAWNAPNPEGYEVQ